MLEKKTALSHFYPIIGEHLLREQLLGREQFVLGSDRSRTEQSGTFPSSASPVFLDSVVRLSGERQW